MKISPAEHKKKKNKRYGFIDGLAGIRVWAMMVAVFCVVFTMAGAVKGQAGAPTVNGLFYGNGDNLRYPATPYAVSVNGSKLYVTLINGILYVAMVVDRSVNDNVFDNGFTSYVNTGGWFDGIGGQVTATHRINSEYAEFNLIVGSGTNAQVFNWKQGYAGQSNQSGGAPQSRYNRTNQTWISDHTINGGNGPTPPPNIVSSSSFAWNMNNYAARVAAGTNAWTMPGTNTNANGWKSPWKGAGGFPGENANTVIDAAEGYPATGQITWSPTYEWEWSMVYEWSVDMTQFGASPVFVVTGASHHSPSKIVNIVNDEFPDQDPDDPPPPLMDFGDLPAPYPTLLANNGARHVINTVSGSALLGSNLDSEVDGQPHTNALGDDLNGVDDEDGVQLLTPMIPGQNAVFRVTIGNPGYLSAFIDFLGSGDGSLQPVTLVSATGPAAVTAGTIGDRHFSVAGVYDLTISVPANASVAGRMPTRWRITNLAGQGGNSPTGEASSGEVEDHIFLASVGQFVWDDLNGNGIYDDGEPLVEGIEVILLDSSFNEVASTFTDANGEYSFTGVNPGNYYMLFDPPEGYGFTLQRQGLDDAENSSPNANTGMTSLFTLHPGENNIFQNAGILDLDPPGQDPTCATSWVHWQEIYGVNLPGENGPMDNPDGDLFSNVLEYAFCLDPESGYTPVPPFCSRQGEDGSIEVFLNRPSGLQDVTYTLFVSADLNGDFETWTEVTESDIEPVVTPNESGNREQVVWHGVDQLPGLEFGGFAVLRVHLDDGTTIATDYTKVCGWRKTTLAEVCQTCAVPLMTHELFSGVVDSVDGNTLNVASSSNGLDFSTVLDEQTAYYIEVLDGANEGHRFDLASGGSDSLTVSLRADLYDNLPHSTVTSLASIASSLEGNQIALRRHRTLGGTLPVDQFGAGDSVADGDCVMFWNGSSYDTYWLADIVEDDPRWVTAANSDMDDFGGTVIAPGVGFFIYRKPGIEPELEPFLLTTTGGVRENDFVLPLRQGKTLVGAMYPVDQNPNGASVSRAMSLSQGFVGGGNASTASRFQLWRPDADPTAIGLSTYWHLQVPSRNYWTDASSLLPDKNNEQFFRRDRAAIVIPKQAIGGYLIPAAWTRDSN